MKLNLTYADGRRDALWHLWCVLENMQNKYPMTGLPDPNAAYKNGWYDVAYTLTQAARRAKK